MKIQIWQMKLPKISYFEYFQLEYLLWIKLQKCIVFIDHIVWQSTFANEVDKSSQVFYGDADLNLWRSAVIFRRGPFAQSLATNVSAAQLAP